MSVVMFSATKKYIHPDKFNPYKDESYEGPELTEEQRKKMTKAAMAAYRRNLSKTLGRHYRAAAPQTEEPKKG